MTLSILHISDLHRDPTTPIGNQALLSALKQDRDRYTLSENPRVTAPNLVVVSGDIVHGVKYGTPDADVVLKRQYDEALSFLNDLADAFVNGDKDRVIIIPGNHDISDHVFRNSLVRINVTPDDRRSIMGQLFHQDSLLRWCWDDLAIYEISDTTLYEQRLAFFCQFYSSFYDSKRSYPLDPAQQLDLFNHPDLGVAVVAFSSCHNNDPLNRQGAIHPECIAEASTRLRQLTSDQSPLRIAVWHHNTEGPPAKSDYMDPDAVHTLIDAGFSLGLHGHQHRPLFLDTQFRHAPHRRMTVISAGTLCGGPAFRHGRAYNIIEVDPHARTGRLHVREMQNDNLLLPIWGPRALPPNPATFLDFDFDSPPQPFVQPNRNTVLLNQAQAFYDRKEYRPAAEILAQLASAEPLARRLLLECYLRLGDTTAIITDFDPPKGPAEAIALMDALWQLDSLQRLTELIALPQVNDSADPALIELRLKYTARLKI